MKAVAFSSMQICFVTKGGIGGLAGRELQSLRGEVAPGAASGKRADGTGRRKDPLTEVRGCTEWQFTAAAVRNLRIQPPLRDSYASLAAQRIDKEWRMA